MESIINRFFCVADDNSKKTAIWCNEKTVTFGALKRRVCGLYKVFMESGVQYDEMIGAQMDNSIDSVILILAAACRGVCLVPVNTTLPVRQTCDMFDSLHIRHIIANSAFFSDPDYYCNQNGMRLCTEDLMKIQDSDEIPDTSMITGDELFFLALTSGLRSTTKLVALTQNIKRKRIDAHIDAFHLTAEDRILISTPLYHSLAFRMVLIPLLLGGTAIMMKSFSPNRWLDCIEDEKVTFTISVSTQLEKIEHLLSSPFLPDLSSLRGVVSSSAMLEPHIKMGLIRKLKCDFYEMYGTSECSTVTVINFKAEPEKTKSVGRALPDAKIKIVDEDNREVLPGNPGEILVKTELMFDGYYKQPNITNLAMDGDGFFRTGDIGKMDKEGYLYYIGRKDELIIIDGINVYPIDIEKKILEWPEIVNCAAFLYPDDNCGDILSIAVVVREGVFLDESSILKYCEKNLPDYQRPQKVFFFRSMPYNQMGKVYKARIVEEIKKRGLK